MKQCGECGISCAGDFCSRECEDLWTYGPSHLPGSAWLDMMVGERNADKRKSIRERGFRIVDGGSAEDYALWP